MSPLGPFADEPPEPMTREHWTAVTKRVRAAWNGLITLERSDAEALIEEIKWLKRRLRRVEEAVEPLVEDLLGSRDSASYS